jgi:signal peptidase II
MKQLKILWITGCIVLLDQISKWIIKSTMSLHESISVLGDFFRITYIENPGMAFGIRFGDNIFFTVFALAASVVILVYLFKMKGEHILTRIAMASILGGAIGNLTDRVIRGKVVDFLDFEFFDIEIPSFHLLVVDFPGYSLTRWPIFNVADIAVTIGMIILFIFVLFEPEGKNSGEEKNTTLIQ